MVGLSKIRKISWFLIAFGAISILYVIYTGLDDKSIHIEEFSRKNSIHSTRLKLQFEVKDILENLTELKEPKSTPSSNDNSKRYDPMEQSKTTDKFDTDEDEELLAAAKRAEARAAQKVEPQTTLRDANDGLVMEYNNKLLTVCEVFGRERPYTPHTGASSNASLSYNDCRQSCTKETKTYATLLRGICYCYNLARFRSVVNLEQCDAMCGKESNSCNIQSKIHGITMRTGSHKDGDSDWTEWMRLPDLKVRVRYRNCSRLQTESTECTPEMERMLDKISPAPEIVYKKFIGCFTGKSINGSSLIRGQRSYRTVSKSHMFCQDYCSNYKTAYAVLSTQPPKKGDTRQCLCVDSLGQSRPTDSCGGMGFAVHWISEKSKPVLKFDSEIKKKGKVLIVARYRSGSSMTQSFFSRYPNSYALFEPGKLMWQDENGDRAMLRILEALYKCDIKKIPLSLHNSVYLLWNYKMLNQRASDNNFAKDVIDCLYARVNCAPYLQEACERAEFINVKTIRITSPDAVREFVQRNNDIQVVHLVRDPRGLLAAQKMFGAKSPASFVCDQLVGLGKMVRELKSEGSSTIHEVFYEQLAVNASYYGTKIYKEMGIEMPTEVSHFLSRDDYEDLNKIPKNASQVIVDDPIFHVYRFLQRYSISEIRDIDAHCANVYDFWPDHYSELLTMYRNHKKEIDVYIPKRGKALVQKLLEKENQP